MAESGSAVRAIAIVPNSFNKPLLDSVDMLTKKAIIIHYTETNVNNETVINDYDKLIEVLMDKMDRLETTN